MSAQAEKSMFLTGSEVKFITGKKQWRAQVKSLIQMGIEHKVRPDGFILVSRSHVEKVLDGIPETDSPKKKDFTPNWNALNATQAKSGKHRSA